MNYKTYKTKFIIRVNSEIDVGSSTVSSVDFVRVPLNCATDSRVNKCFYSVNVNSLDYDAVIRLH